MLAHNGLAQHLADNHRCQTDDDGTGAHFHIGKALILGHDAAAEGDKAIADGQTDDLHAARVNPLRPRHIAVDAGSAKGRAMLRAQVEVQNPHQCCAHKEHNPNGARQQLCIGGEQERNLVDINRLVRLAHNIQVDGIKGNLGQNTGQDVRDAQSGVQETGDNTGGHSGKEGGQQRQLRIDPLEHQHDANRTAGCHAAIHGQVGNAQHSEGHKHAQRQDAPDKALGNAAGERPHQGRELQGSKVFGDGYHQRIQHGFLPPKIGVIQQKAPGNSLPGVYSAC